MYAFITILTGLITAHNSKPAVNFVVIGDTQWGYSVFRKAIKDINSKKSPEFLAHVGDQETCGGKVMLKRFRKRASGLRIPYWLTIGNHELVMCSRRYALYRSNWYKWRDYWKYRRFPNDPRAPLSTYYYFDIVRAKHTFRFVFIDTSFAHISKKQADWFDLVLSRTPTNGSILIFTHRPFPVPPKIAKNRIYYSGKRRWHTYRRMDPAAYRRSGRHKSYGWFMWNTLIRYKSKVRAIFHGHQHAYRSYTLHGIRGYCSGGGGGYLFRNKGQRTYEVYHYLSVRISSDSLNVKIHPIKK